MQTNSSIKLFSVSQGWDGGETLTSAGTIDAWNETLKRDKFLNQSRTYGGQLDETELAKGYFITQEDVDYENMKVEIDGSTFTVIGQDRHVMRKRPGDAAGRYHHTEVFYS